MKTKVCSSCHKRKSVFSFYYAPHHKDGLSSQCKDCKKESTFRNNQYRGTEQLCACGCGQTIQSVDRWGKKREFAGGHVRRGAKHTLASKAKMSLWQIGKTISQATRKKISKTSRERGVNKGAKNGSWKGGKIKDKSGYILVRMPDHPDARRDGYVRENRLIAEIKLGRRLKRKEVSHHINGNKSDNRPENIQVLKWSEHARLHLLQRRHKHG